MRLPAFLRRERDLRMVWRIPQTPRPSYLVGTAHFFPHSFRRPLRRLLRKVDRVYLEGPVDEASLERIAAHGRDGADTVSLVDQIDPAAVIEICRTVQRRMGCMVHRRPYFLPTPPGRECFEEYAGGLRPWMAFFSLWSLCLGWRHSVDREASEVAIELGLPLSALETVEEQIEVLDSIPVERIVRQLNAVREWPAYGERYVEAFLAGDLETLQELMARFRIRTRDPITVRDRVLHERIRDRLSAGPIAAFVGFPHVPGLQRLFAEEGTPLEQIET